MARMINASQNEMGETSPNATALARDQYELTLSHPPEASEQINSKKFIFIGGVEVTVEDFVAIWNGEDILPKLSQREKDIQRKYKWRDDMKFKPRIIREYSTMYKMLARDRLYEKAEENKRKLKIIIKKYHLSVNRREILSMDRVLTVLSGGQMKFDDVSAFIATSAEPVVGDATIVKAAAHDSCDIDGSKLVETRYIDNNTIEPLTTLTQDQRQAIVKVLELTDKELSLIPIIIAERLIAGQKLTNDEFHEMSSLKNIGTAKIITIIKCMRLALFGVGIAMFNVPELHLNIHIASDLMMANIGLVGAWATTKYPADCRKPVVKSASSVKKYKALAKKLTEKVELLRQTPAGQVRLTLLSETIRSTYEEDASDNVVRLQAFVKYLDGNPKIENDFNQICYSGDRPLNEVTGALDAAFDYISAIAAIEGATSAKALSE